MNRKNMSKENIEKIKKQYHFNSPFPKPKRDRRVFELHNTGLSLREIADIFKISRARVGQIITREKSKKVVAENYR